MGVVRLRTGTIRLDWANTSIVAGQDGLFFTPLASDVSCDTRCSRRFRMREILWAWTPQVSRGASVRLLGHFERLRARWDSRFTLR